MSDNTSSNLAVNLKRLRETRGLSQQALAELSGVPRPTVAHLESGNANPTVLVLMRVCQAVGVSMDQLVESPGVGARFYAKQSLPRRSRAGTVISQIMVDPPPGHGIERLELAPKARHAVPGQSNGKRYLACEDGELEVDVEGAMYRLEAGDVITLRGEVGHEYKNSGRKPAVAYCVTVPQG
ncbi:MAG: XRE family transcriptional regulator [Polyangiaceae bacterium]|nr:XRE family transcriptional regulator [Polyangiaceae bacterium]